MSHQVWFMWYWKSSQGLCGRVQERTYSMDLNVTPLISQSISIDMTLIRQWLFLDMKQKLKQQEKKTLVNIIKIKHFLLLLVIKNTIKKTKQKPQDKEIFVYSLIDEGLISVVCKEHV